jgi:hypothetical protein
MNASASNNDRASPVPIPLVSTARLLIVAKANTMASAAHITLETPGRHSGEPIRSQSGCRCDTITPSYQAGSASQRWCDIVMKLERAPAALGRLQGSKAAPNEARPPGGPLIAA